MALQKIRLGDYIVRSTLNNKDLKYGTELIVGVNNEGNIITPKGDVDGVDLLPYKIVRNGAFVYNPSRLNIGSIAQYKGDLCIVSHLYIIFYLTERGRKIIDPNWLYIYFRRKEFQREVDFRNFGSQRPEFSFDKMCDIEILLPDIEIQKKYVDVYLSMIENQKAYERGLDDIKTTMGMFFDKIKKSDNLSLGKIIKFVSSKNVDFTVPFSQLRGINEFGEFTSTRDSIGADDIDKYLIIKDKTYAVNFMCLGNFGKFYLAYNDFNEDYLVSPACNNFRLINNDIDPYYLLYALQRDEFQRKCVVLGDGNTRGGINITDFSGIDIPVPSKKDQEVIADLYLSFENRRKLNERLKNQIKDICPILIKGSIEEEGLKYAGNTKEN